VREESRVQIPGRPNFTQHLTWFTTANFTEWFVTATSTQVKADVLPLDLWRAGRPN